jgi:fatty-acid desaturase
MFIAFWVFSIIISIFVGFEFLVAFALIPFIHAKIGFGLLNTFGHKGNQPSNNMWLNMLIAGEGYHRNHHNDNKRILLGKWDTGGRLANAIFKR